MENNYYQKYLKYKRKYLELKNMIGGDYGKCNGGPTKTNCGCNGFSSTNTAPNNDTNCETLVKRDTIKGKNQSVKCNHPFEYHVLKI